MEAFQKSIPIVDAYVTLCDKGDMRDFWTVSTEAHTDPNLNTTQHRASAANLPFQYNMTNNPPLVMDPLCAILITLL